MFTNSTLRDYFNIQLGSGLLGNCTDTATPTVSTPVHNFVSSRQMDKNTYTRVYCQYCQDPDHKQRSFKRCSKCKKTCMPVSLYTPVHLLFSRR